MKSPDDPSEEFEAGIAPPRTESPAKLSVEEVLKDLHGGMRTKGFLHKYDLTMTQFESLLKQLIRKGLFTREDFKLWKAHRLAPAPPAESLNAGEGLRDVGRSNNVETYVITEPERNHPWALQLFSANREQIKGAQFKVNLHGRKYSFVVEQLLFRGPVEMLPNVGVSKEESKQKRQEALDFISSHGWAAYLEQRAFTANFDTETTQTVRKARLVLLHCKNQTFLAALHTPVPAINLYVGSSIETIRHRLSKSVDTSVLDI
ncbi:MAG: hypothetical protein ACLP5H_12960 [Desulfomonilaceae bacterium]